MGMVFEHRGGEPQGGVASDPGLWYENLFLCPRQVSQTNNMRVVSGTARGRRLKAPAGRTTRPTADKVKEAIFDLLRLELNGCLVLDLFAGSGALGIEALSRGAKRAVFVEKDRVALRFLEANLEACSMWDRAEVVKADAIRFLRRGSRGTRFGLVLADPPYEKGLALRCLWGVEKGDWLEKEGILVLEHSLREDLPENCEALLRLELRRYGDTCISFYGIAKSPSAASRAQQKAGQGLWPG